MALIDNQRSRYPERNRTGTAAARRRSGRTGSASSFRCRSNNQARESSLNQIKFSAQVFELQEVYRFLEGTLDVLEFDLYVLTGLQQTLARRHIVALREDRESGTRRTTSPVSGSK